jgi:hypothetical protein
VVAAGVAVTLLGCTVSVSVNAPGANWYRADPGQIIFGSDLDPTFQFVSDKTTSIRQEGKVAFVGTLPRMITGQIDMTIAKDGGEARSSGSFPFTNATNWVSGKYNLSDFSPGHYVFTMMFQSEALATGELDVTAP